MHEDLSEKNSILTCDRPFKILTPQAHRDLNTPLAKKSDIVELTTVN